MTSKIVVNNIEPDAGISTVTVNGDCQATTFKGDGSNLTGIDATSIKHTDGNVKIQANNSGAVVSGILTVNQDDDRTTFMTGNSVGIGTTNTAGRNAGVSTATGTLIYNTTTESLEFYTGNLWVATNLIPLLNSVTGDILNGSATNLVINASNITDSVSVKYSNNSSGSVIATDSSPSISGSNVTSTVPSAVYGTSAGTVVKIEIIKQLKEIRRASVARRSLINNGILMYISSDAKIISVVNKIAPEHLELNIKNYKLLVPKIKNSGSICLGKYAVMAMTDYNVGSNHVLPTNGSAKYSSGISVNEFYKRISYINLSKKGIESLGPSVITLANYEGLVGHAQSVVKRIRRK